MGFSLVLNKGFQIHGLGSLQSAGIIEKDPQNLHLHKTIFVCLAISASALMEEPCHFDLYLDPYIPSSWNLDLHYTQA